MKLTRLVSFGCDTGVTCENKCLEEWLCLEGRQRTTVDPFRLIWLMILCRQALLQVTGVGHDSSRIATHRFVDLWFAMGSVPKRQRTPNQKTLVCNKGMRRHMKPLHGKTIHARRSNQSTKTDEGSINMPVHRDRLGDRTMNHCVL